MYTKERKFRMGNGVKGSIVSIYEKWIDVFSYIFAIIYLLCRATFLTNKYVEKKYV